MRKPQHPARLSRLAPLAVGGAVALMAALAVAPVAARAEAGNVVGGGATTISGGGSDMVITYSTGGAGGGGTVHSQSGRPTRFAGSHGDGPLVEYLTPAVPADPGREAWLIGGGDNTEVVYVRPR